jgi:probable rRNA maturation factor
MIPVVHIHRRLNSSRIDLPWLTKTVNAAVPMVLKHLKGESPPLAQLPEVEVIIVRDSKIAKIHKEFMNDPSATDVITFQHGEIIVSADTASRVGPKHGNDQDAELCLYIIHGLVHLAGWDDHEPKEAAEMKVIQDRILKKVGRMFERD